MEGPQSCPLFRGSTVASNFQGDKVLKLAEMCRKLETEEEKVLPFYMCSLSTEDEEKVASAAAEPPSEPLAEVSLSGLGQCLAR